MATYQAVAEPAWLRLTEPARAQTPGLGVVAAGLAGGLLAALLLADGAGVNLLLCALVATAGAVPVARRSGRAVRPWTVVWAIVALALLLVPALVAGGWPVTVAVVAATGAGSLALHGGRRWAGVLLGQLGVWSHLLTALPWAAGALRGTHRPDRARMLTVLKAVAVSAVLLLVFGALFAGADAAVGDLFDSLTPSVDLSGLPVRGLLFLLGAAAALGAAHTAAAPRRWDRLPVPEGREHGRLEWALPLIALNLLFGLFVTVQLVVLIGGYQAIMSRTGLTPAEYARQGFWQLLWVTVLTLIVVALAKRWAPRSTPADHRLVKLLLGTLCTLTLVVVASALTRMTLYVNAFGLTRLRISVTAVELWLGVVFLLVLVAGALGGARWLPRAVALSAAVAVAGYGLIGPDALIAEQNVDRYLQSGRIDVAYLRGLSADAVPALDRLPGEYRVCALQAIAADLGDPAIPAAPWYATSLAEARARAILRQRPVEPDASCSHVGITDRP